MYQDQARSNPYAKTQLRTHRKINKNEYKKIKEIYIENNH